jgi:hypothetical protein
LPRYPGQRLQELSSGIAFPERSWHHLLRLTEQEIIADYMAIAGCTEVAARSVLMYLDLQDPVIPSAENSPRTADSTPRKDSEAPPAG